MTASLAPGALPDPASAASSPDETAAPVALTAEPPESGVLAMPLGSTAMRVITLALLVTAFSVSVSTAQAEEKVCFYEDTNYGGKSFCTSSDAAQVPHNDVYSSIKFMDDTHYVEVYEHTSFRGMRIPIMDDAVRLKRLNDEISSIKVIPRTTDRHACLYQDTDYNGTPYCAEAGTDVMSLTDPDLDNDMSSAILSPGATVDMYEDKDLKGRKVRIIQSESDFRDRDIDMNDKVSSFSVRDVAWVQDEIVVRSMTGDASGETIPESLTYKFEYDGDEMKAVHMVMRTGDAGRAFDVMIGSHYFEYRSGQGEKLLRAMLLYAHNREEIDKDAGLGKYSFSYSVIQQSSLTAPKWLMGVTEWDEQGRAQVVYKYLMAGGILAAMRDNVMAGNDPLKDVELRPGFNGLLIGAYVLKYADDDSVTLKEVNTYRMAKTWCRNDCGAPPEVSSPIPDFRYARSIDYQWEYTGDEGSFKTTFVHHGGDAAGDDPVAFYEQESKAEQVDPDTDRPVVIDEFANNVYNLDGNAEPIHLWQYELTDKRVDKPVVYDYVFALAMMSIGSPLEGASDVSFGGVLESGGSGGSGEDDPDNYFGDLLIDMLDKRSSGLGTTIAQVAPFGP